MKKETDNANVSESRQSRKLVGVQGRGGMLVKTNIQIHWDLKMLNKHCTGEHSHYPDESKWLLLMKGHCGSHPCRPHTVASAQSTCT